MRFTILLLCLFAGRVFLQCDAAGGSGAGGCGVLDVVGNAVATPTPNPLGEAIGSIISYACKAGYTTNGLPDGPTSWTVTCTSIGFSNDEIQCKKIFTKPAVQAYDGELRFKVGDDAEIAFYHGEDRFTANNLISGLSGAIETLDDVQTSLSNISSVLGEASTLLKSEISSRISATTMLLNDLAQQVGAEAQIARNAELSLADQITLKASTADLNSEIASLNSLKTDKADFETLSLTVSLLRADHETVTDLDNINITSLSTLKTVLETYTDLAVSALKSSLEAKLNSTKVVVDRIVACNQNGQFYNPTTQTCSASSSISFTSTPCTLSSKGALQFDATKGLLVCNGSSWLTSFVAELGSKGNPAQSCSALFSSLSGAKSDFYYVKDVLVYCDKTQDASLGGDGSSAASYSVSCDVIYNIWKLYVPKSYFIGTSSSDAKPQFCQNGVNYGGDGSQTNPGSSCENVLLKWGKAINNQYWIGSSQQECNDGVSSTKGSSCPLLKALGRPSGVYYIARPSATPSQSYCEMDMQGGGWTMILSSDLSGGYGEFDNTMWGSPNSGGSDFRFAATGTMLTAMFSVASTVGTADMFVRTTAGSQQVIKGFTSLSGFSGTCTSCNCGGVLLSNNYWWHGGRGGCYGSTHFGLSIDSNNHCACGATHHWGHFHRAGVDTGVYMFNSDCIEEVEWNKRFVFYLRAAQQ